MSAATLNITDNDAPQYTLTVNPTTIDEDAGTTTVTASTGGTTFLEDQTIALSFGGRRRRGPTTAWMTNADVDRRSVVCVDNRACGG